jgi:hypothetical protein
VPIHAGFAYAIQIRKKVLNDSVLLAYHAGSISRTLFAPFLLGGPPNVTLDFYLDPPTITFDPNQPSGFLLTITGFGDLGIDFIGPPAESRAVKIQIVALIRPRFKVTSGELDFAPEVGDVSLTTWSFAIISGAAFSSDANTYLSGAVFRERLESNLAFALTGPLQLPPIQFGALGSSFDIANTSSVSAVLDDSIMIGLNLRKGPLEVVGQIQELASFAGSHDIALALNPAILPVVFAGALGSLNNAVADQGATLDSFTMTLASGKVSVAGSAHNDLGSVNFSMDAVLSLYAAKSGKFFQYLDRPVQVKPRIWPAVSFHVANVQVDVEPAIWVRVVEVLGTVFTGAVAPLFIQDLLRGVTQQVTFASQAVPLGDAISRVQYLAPLRDGDPRVKVRINDFSIGADAIFAGLGVTPLLPAPTLMGLLSLPSNYLGRPIRYELVPPIGVSTDNPALRIHWRVQDLSSGHLVVDEDTAAAGHLVRDLRVADFGSASVSLGISCELYRKIGSEVIPIFSDGIQLAITSALLPGELTRWRYQVKNPQVGYSEHDQEWKYQGELRVQRWSAVHRLDKPCRNAQHHSKYIGNVDLLDDFPYPLTEIADRRQGLCAYCFFGGPGTRRPFL